MPAGSTSPGRARLKNVRPAPAVTARRLSSRFFQTRIFTVAALSVGLLLPGLLPAQSFSKKDLAPLNSPEKPLPENLQSREQSLQQIFHDYWQDRLQHDPEMASMLGDRRYDDRLSDHSPQAYEQALERGQSFIERLGVIDTTGMPAQQRLSKQLLVHDLVDQQETSLCKPWQTPVTQLSGLPVDLPKLAAALRFTSAVDYEHYLTRLQQVPTAFQQISAGMMLGQQAGRGEPQSILRLVLPQVEAVASAKPEDTPFARPLHHFPAGIPPSEQVKIRARVLAAIRTQVQPAYARFAKYLKGVAIPQARTDPGLWASRDGDVCYAYWVQHYTTSEMTPDQVHQMGLEEVAYIAPQLQSIAQKVGFKDLQSFQQALRLDPKEHAQSASQLIALYRHYLQQMEARLPILVRTLPKIPLVVVPMPPSDSNPSPADYRPGVPNDPAQLRIDTADIHQRLLTQVEARAYHLGLPGHHLQTALAAQQTGLPEFRRHETYPAFTAGWELYAEQLGKEVGFYQDPYSEYGMLENQMTCAVRLVVDTGIHSGRWTRDRAVQYFRDHTALDDASIQNEVDRSIALPGQALACDVGRLKFLELRGEAQKALGKNFDIRAFHDLVLDSGPLPLDILDQRVAAWIQQQQIHANKG